jgi:hypothetical protein
MSGKAGIVLVNYKDYANKFLAECRDSLRKQSYPDFNVYIVDNASSETSREYIKNNYPEAVIIPRKDGNYAAANNAGMKKAGEDGCQYFVIANMDTCFDRDWLFELVVAMKGLKDAGFVQSKMLLYPETKEESGRPRLNSLGNIMNFLGFGYTSAYKESDRDIDGYPEITGYASGCSFITGKEIIDKIGYYDEEYWMYHDDVEMGWRVKLAGYSIYLAPKSRVYHRYEFGRSIRMLYYMERNRYLVMFHYYTCPTLFLLLPAIAAMEAGMMVYSIAGGWAGTKIKVCLYFWKPSTWVKIMQKRRRVKALRVTKEKDIIKYFEGRVLFQEIDNPVLKYVANPAFNIYWNIIKRIIHW